MKAFFVPISLLSLILLVSVFTGSSICKDTKEWVKTLNSISALAEDEKWGEANKQLADAETAWLQQTAAYHIIMEHQDLDEAEKLFSGAIAACREENEVELQILLSQLITQLEFLAETQKISWQNIL